MISSQMLKGHENTGQRRGLSRSLDDFKNFIDLQVPILIVFHKADI